eukprot:6732184-Prymnesium_polylepis.1
MGRVAVLRTARSAAPAPRWRGCCSRVPGGGVPGGGVRCAVHSARERQSRLSKNIDAAFNGFSFAFGGRSCPTTTFCASERRARRSASTSSAACVARLKQAATGEVRLPAASGALCANMRISLSRGPPTP